MTVLRRNGFQLARTKRPFGNSLASAAVVLLLTPGLDAASAPGPRLTSLQGQVFVRVLGQPRDIPGQQDQPLTPGVSLRTGASSHAEVLLPDGMLIRLRPNTQIRLSARRRHHGRQSVALFIGRLWSRIPTVRNGTGYDLITANATARVGNTALFEMGVGPDGNARIHVIDGEVDVLDRATRVNIADGQAVDSGPSGMGVPFDSRSGDWQPWERAGNLQALRDGSRIAAALVKSATVRRNVLRNMLAEHEALREKRRSLIAISSPDDNDAAAELRSTAGSLADLSDRMAHLADQVDAQAGMAAALVALALGHDGAMSNPKSVLKKARIMGLLRAQVSRIAADAVEVVLPDLNPPSTAEPAGVESMLQRSDQSLQRIATILKKLGELLEDAEKRRDQVKAKCVEDNIEAIRGLQKVATQARNDIEAGAGTRQTTLVDSAFMRLSVSIQKCEQLFVDGKRCAGEGEVADGEVELAVLIDADIADPTQEVEDELERLPEASPFQ